MESYIDCSAGREGGRKGEGRGAYPIVNAPGTSFAPLLAASMNPGPPPVVIYIDCSGWSFTSSSMMEYDW